MTKNAHRGIRTTFRRLFARILRTKSVEKFGRTLALLIEQASNILQLKQLYVWLSKFNQTSLMLAKDQVLAKWDSKCLDQVTVIEVRFLHKPVELCRELLKASSDWNIGGSAEIIMRRLFFRNRMALPSEMAFAA